MRSRATEHPIRHQWGGDHNEPTGVNPAEFGRFTSSEDLLERAIHPPLTPLDIDALQKEQDERLNAALRVPVEQPLA